jgi:hypothetical protein
MKSKVLEGRGAGAVREWSPLELAEVKTPRTFKGTVLLLRKSLLLGCWNA